MADERMDHRGDQSHQGHPMTLRRATVRVAAVLVCAGILPVLWVGRAFGQSSLSVAPSATSPGGSVTFSGVVPVTGAASCPSGDSAQLTATVALFPPDGFGPQAARDSNGAFRATYTVPATTPVGTYAVAVRCGGANTGVSANLQVVAASSTTTTTAPTSTTTTALPASATTTGQPTSPTVIAPPQPTTKNSRRGGWLALGITGAVAAAAAATIAVRRRRIRRAQGRPTGPPAPGGGDDRP